MRTTAIPLLMALGIAGCAAQTSGSNFTRNETGQMQTVQQGVVQGTRVVTVQGSGPNVAGAAAGAAVGSSVGGPVSTVGGAVAGSAVQGAASTRNALEITILLDNGQTVAVVQEGPLDAFRPGDKVNVTTSGGTTRVSRR